LRPLRIEFPGAVYHVTSRGDRREPIYRDDAGRQCQLDVFAEALARFDADVQANCLMRADSGVRSLLSPLRQSAKLPEAVSLKDGRSM